VTDPAVADAARAAAVTLAPELGADLPAQVEAALYDVEHGPQRPCQYDPLAIIGAATGVGSLIVTIAQLAWSVYTDRRDHGHEPAPEAIARQVRISLRERDLPLPAGADRITDVVITEITHRAASRETD
jgi:NADPH:quinone reductase-like Zn-dependent oxidoreductase